ncbi:MAG: hypothetical protein ACI8PW_001966 [Methylophilaceae bacterium]|jgi:hypothetical protein
MLCLFRKMGHYGYSHMKQRVQASMCIQPVLMEACERDFLSEDVYADIIIVKMNEGHDFISIRVEDMLAIAKRTPKLIAKGVKLAIESFRRPTFDIISGVEVVSNFLENSVSTLSPNVVVAYGKLALDVLQHDRLELADEIHRILAVSLQKINPSDRNLSKKERKISAKLLEAPSRPHIELRLTPVAAAIRNIYSGR